MGKCDICKAETNKPSWVGRLKSEYKRPLCGECVLIMKEHLCVAGIDFVIRDAGSGVWVINIQGIGGSTAFACPLIRE